MRRQVLFPILMGLLGFGLLALLFNRHGGTVFGIPDDSFASLLVLSCWALFLVGGVLASGRVGEIVRNLVIWAVILLALSAIYLYRYNLQEFGAEMTAGLIPGLPVTRTGLNGATQVILHKTQSGHFETMGSVDGRRVRFLIDTGASQVVLSYRDAQAVGIDVSKLAFNQTVQTANGQAKAAPTRLASVALGPIRREDIRASVSAPGMLDESLLGMNFLGTLTSLRMNRDMLVLQD